MSSEAKRAHSKLHSVLSLVTTMVRALVVVAYSSSLVALTIARRPIDTSIKPSTSSGWFKFHVRCVAFWAS